jgi:phosphohistidine phosphatase
MVIGHNPGLHELALSLSGPANARPELARLASAYPTAGLSEFLIATSWAKTGPGAASLQRFLQPADLAL